MTAKSSTPGALRFLGFILFTLGSIALFIGGVAEACRRWRYESLGEHIDKAQGLLSAENGYPIAVALFLLALASLFVAIRCWSSWKKWKIFYHAW